MRTVGQNEETQLRIRGLIRSQHSHEKQWWKGRETLLEKQQARGDRKKELDAVLYAFAFRYSSWPRFQLLETDSNCQLQTFHRCTR
jgi:hypothetical protein